jgi:nucleolar protein 6
MKSKRAAAASAEDARPADVPQDQTNKKRKRSDDDADQSKDATAGQGEKRVKKYKEERKEKKKEKKEKKKQDKEERKANKPKKDKSKYNNKSRKEKKEELKNLQNLPEGMDVDDDEGSANAAEAVTKPEAEVEPKTNGKSEDKASKKQDKEDKKKEKKDRKKEKKETKKKEKDNKDESSATKNATQGEDAIDLDSSSAQKAGRNIVFVGNLPYSATAASITAHFASLKPVAVRCLTKKDDPKACRGIAFVEFATSTHQRTCLDKFHHTMFDDGISPPRKINIELT